MMFMAHLSEDYKGCLFWLVGIADEKQSQEVPRTRSIPVDVISYWSTNTYFISIIINKHNRAPSSY